MSIEVYWYHLTSTLEQISTAVRLYRFTNSLWQCGQNNVAQLFSSALISAGMVKTYDPGPS